jgi:hypothetical protein
MWIGSGDRIEMKMETDLRSGSPDEKCEYMDMTVQQAMPLEDLTSKNAHQERGILN